MRHAGDGGQLSLIPIPDRVEERRKSVGLSQAQLAPMIKPGLSASYYNQWVKGTMKTRATIEELNRLAAAWLDAQDKADAAMTIVERDIPWMELDISNEIWAAFEYAYSYGDFNVVYGPPGRSKTYTALQYSRQYGTWYVTLSEVTSSLTSGMEAIAEALGLKVEWSTSFRRRHSKEIRRKLTEAQRMLIIDEAQFAAQPLIEEIRSIWDETKVGIVLIGNERVYSQMTGGQKRAAFAQIRSRLALRVTPSRPTDADVRRVAGAWGVKSEGAIRFCTALVKKDGAGGLRDVSLTLRLAIAARGDAASVNEADVRSAWRSRGMETR
jgi:DNA transposition AAA+ family ATPase